MAWAVTDLAGPRLPQEKGSGVNVSTPFLL